jgi:hypothetical protein
MHRYFVFHFAFEKRMMKDHFSLFTARSWRKVIYHRFSSARMAGRFFRI